MEFNIKRFAQLIKRDFITYRKPLLFGIATLFLFLLALSSFLWFTNVNQVQQLDDDYWSSWLVVFVFFGGLVFTSLVFWEFRTPAGRISFLSLPASNFEKVLSRWIYTLVLYPLVTLTSIYMVYLICKLFYTNITWVSMEFSRLTNDLTMLYLLIHGVMLMFGIWFNKYVAPKAALISFAAFLIGTVCFSLFIYVVFNNLFDGMMMDREIRVHPKPEFQQSMEVTVFPIVGTLLLVFIPVFFFVVSYFKMKEKQV